MRVGINLLVRNLPEEPAQLRATEFAIQSLLHSDLRETDWRHTSILWTHASVC